MRLTIEIEDGLLDAARQITGEKSNGLVITKALRNLVEQENKRRLAEMREGSKGAAHYTETPEADDSPSSSPSMDTESIPGGTIVDLAALEVKQRAVRCRLIGSDRTITLRPNGIWDVVPGEIVTVRTNKQWRYSGHAYLSGEIQRTRIDPAALDLEPLVLEDTGTWDPAEEYWGEEEDPVPPWAKPIISAGPRPEYEMEQIIPGEDPDNPDEDPIIYSVDLKNAGHFQEAEELLQKLCGKDLRCLDAHVHLGNLCFDHYLEKAIRHYEVGVRIGELSLGPDFSGVLSWLCVDNRPFLRCMQGYGLSLWRLGRFDEAGDVFNRMLWLSPSDNQGIRFLIDEVASERSWKARQEL